MWKSECAHFELKIVNPMTDGRTANETSSSHYRLPNEA